MNAIPRHILDLLNDDMVSHGLLVQCVHEAESRGDQPQPSWKEVLEELLSSEVEIGVAKSKRADYVEFIAWRGTVDERISRAVECVDKAIPWDWEFAYWLCLRKNIDRYEGEEERGMGVRARDGGQSAVSH